jgi:hypothetical protein
VKSFVAALFGVAIAADALAQGAPRLVWSDRYSPANGYDAAGAIAADAQGNVYVGGSAPTAASVSSLVVIKYGPAGTREWVARHSGPGGKALNVAVDGQGNVFAAGYRWVNPFEYEEVVLKFDPNGRELWWRRLTGRSTKLLPDPAGHLYVIGRHSDGYEDDWSVIKFSPDGGLLWEIRYGHTQGLNDEPANGLFDAAGNVIVAGTVGTDFGPRPGDVSVATYSPDGAVLWQRFYGQPDRHEFVDDFGIDQSGTIYLIGGRAASGAGYEPAVELWLKYNREGALVGETLGGPTTNGDFGTAVVDRDGNLYAATFSRLTRYSPAGAPRWRTEFTSPRFGVTLPIVQLSPTGEVVVGATSFDGSSLGDYLIYAFDAAGTMQWRYRFNGPANGDDTLEGLCVDSAGDVIVTGTSWNQYASTGGSADDIVTLKVGGGPASLTTLSAGGRYGRSPGGGSP